jgi:hypothetical protein
VRGIDGLAVAVHDGAMKRVFDERTRVRAVEQTLDVCFILREEHRRSPVASEPSAAVGRVVQLDGRSGLFLIPHLGLW